MCWDLQSPTRGALFTYYRSVDFDVGLYIILHLPLVLFLTHSHLVPSFSCQEVDMMSTPTFSRRLELEIRLATSYIKLHEVFFSLGYDGTRIIRHLVGVKVNGESLPLYLHLEHPSAGPEANSERSALSVV